MRISDWSSDVCSSDLSQDCADSYGSAIAFNEVLELTPERYRERTLARLDGSWSATLDGCHTYSALPSLELFDARGKVPENVQRIEVVHSSIKARASAREEIGRAACRERVGEYVYITVVAE